MIPIKILVMGLPTSGKTYTAKVLAHHLNVANYNADALREASNDWDFSTEGRLRQSNRMRLLADFEISQNRSVICDFVCPTVETRKLFKPDFIIWLNTIHHSKYPDTDKIFVDPKKPNMVIMYWMTDDQIIQRFEERYKIYLAQI